MNAYTNLPLAARIAIPIGIVLLVGMLLYMTAFRQPQPVTVIETKDYDLYATAKLVLEKAGITPNMDASSGKFVLLVPAGDNAQDAATALAAAGIKDRTGKAKPLKCQDAPGFTATKAATQAYTDCTASKTIQDMLLAAGATAAIVKVSVEDNTSLTGPEKITSVMAQVFLPKSMQDTWDAEQAARAISKALSTSIDRVTITDSHLQIMFDGSSSSGTAAAGSTGSTPGSLSSLGCSDIATATEVETKKAAVRSCYEQSLGTKLTELLGGSDRYVLIVDPMIDSVSTQTTSTTNTQGPATSRSTQSGSGTQSEDVSTPANTTERTSVNPAGDIKQLRITVILDKSVVTEDQKIAVTSLLATQILPERGDPAPVVKMSQFAGGAAHKPTTEDFAAIGKAAVADDSEPSPATTTFSTRTKTPGWMYGLLSLLVLGIGATVAVLVRRSRAMDAERQRMESAFSQEQKLFENFTQQNPDRLADDLNALFGAPSAPERSY